MSDKRRKMIRTAAGLLLAAAAAAVLLLPALQSARVTAVSYSAKQSSSADETEFVESGADHGGTVNPNLADLEELCELPGIGETIAQLIIDEREANGPYRYPEDLLRVRGIGEAKLEKIRDLLDLSE